MKYTADGLENDLNRDPIYQAGLKHLKDLVDRSNGVVEGQIIDPGQPDPTAQAIEDMKTLSHIEGQLDAGKPVTQTMYNTVDEIYHRHKKGQGL